MWLFTKHGFYSVVADREDRGVWVRARFAGDLERLRGAALPELGEVSETPHADYRFRALASKDGWARAAAKLAADIDYGNFKDSVHEVDAARASTYLEVWSVLRRASQGRSRH